MIVHILTISVIFYFSDNPNANVYFFNKCMNLIYVDEELRTLSYEILNIIYNYLFFFFFLEEKDVIFFLNQSLFIIFLL